MSKIDKALASFEHQKRLLDDETLSKDDIWVNHTADLISQFIGKESDLYDYTIRKRESRTGFFFYDLPYKGDTTNSYNTDIATAKRLIQSCQNYIKNNGLYRPVNQSNNFLGSIDNQTLWGVITVIFPLIFGVGYWTGRYQEKMESPTTPSVKVNSLDSTYNHSSLKNQEIRKDTTHK